MTKSSRNILLSLLAVFLPAMAFAQTQPAAPAAPPPRPRPVIVVTPSPNQQFQRQVDRQQFQNKQNQSALQQQLRQDNLTRQRNNATDPALRNQLDSADQSQQQLYRARQDDAVRRDPILQRPDANGSVPARSSTAGR